MATALSTDYNTLNGNIVKDIFETTDEDGNTVPEIRLLGQSNDGVSVTYNVAGARDAMYAINTQIQGAIERGLNGITTSLGRKLLWRGIYPDE